MIEIYTYLGSNPETLKPFHEVQHYDGDINYVDGSIQLVIDGCIIFRSDFIDDINHLWPLFIDALTELKINHKAKGYYASVYWPFEMEILEDDMMLISVGFPSDPNSTSATCQLSELIDVVRSEGEKFYHAAYHLGIYSETSFLNEMKLLNAL